MDFLSNGTDSAPAWQKVGLHLIVAFFGGLLVAAIYRWTRPRSHINPSFPPTLVLLAILIAMVTQVIGSNLSRAFSLVGVLSIVRFRTVVRDTQDTAFVIFAVVVGMAAGAGAYDIAAVGLAVGGVAAAIVRTRVDPGWTATESTLNVRIGLGADPKTLTKTVFEKYLATHEIHSVTTVRQGAALDFVFLIHPRPHFDPTEFVKELNKLEGVQSVELNRKEPDQP
jgi:hypothetical protein